MVRRANVVFDESPPDDFDPSDPYKDPVAMLEMREHIELIIFRNVSILFNNILNLLEVSVGVKMLVPLVSMLPKSNLQNDMIFRVIRRLVKHQYKFLTKIGRKKL
ncbi:hypothetical protein MKW98_002519 [Papaver atlanticum]|uniref:Uncharacterized protein n=1 Tax=Papaver atlanticum TaxID=357466 RepID=A0AAD4SBI5_9MAGN|nr:hypothetical protein MKW98_002519 [Papaver atlanticum]